MKKFLAAVLVAITLLIAAPVSAEVKTFEGVGEYVMDDSVSFDVAKLRAQQKAVRAAQAKAGIYLKTFSRYVNSELSDDEIVAATAAALTVTDTKITRSIVSYDVILIQATVTVTIDSDAITKWLDRDESDRETIIAQNKDLQQKIDENKKELAELKKKLAEHERLAKETPKETTPASTQQVGGQIFEGVGEYRLGSSETIINAEKGARVLAMQNALEKAGILVDHYARVKDFELDKSVITTKSRAVLKVIDAKPEWKDFVCRTTIKVEINVAELNKWLEQEAKKSK